MRNRRYGLLAISSVAVFALAWLLSACGGGGTTTLISAILTGNSGVASSATSRVARDAIVRIQTVANILQQANLVRFQTASRGRNALDFDEESGLYYTVDWSNEGARIRYFQDAGGSQLVGETLYRARNNSYELMFDIVGGRQPIRAYVKLAETNTPDRLRLRARYEDARTGEKISIDGELIAAPSIQSRQARPQQEDPHTPDWIDEYDWWTNEDDVFFGDDYFGENPFCGDEEYFTWQDDFEFNYGEEECPTYEDVTDFELVRFEGSMSYEGCGKTLQITNAQVDFETGQITGNCAIDGDTGTINYNKNTGQGQIVLNTAQGQVTIQFRGDEIEAIYPDGRRERVRLSQWLDPCAGVAQASNIARTSGVRK